MIVTHVDINEIYEFLLSDEFIRSVTITENGQPIAALMRYEIFIANQEDGNLHPYLDHLSNQVIDFVDLPIFLRENKSEIKPSLVQCSEPPNGVLVPYDRYIEWSSLMKPTALLASEITDEDMDAIMNSPIPDECYEYDHEMDNEEVK